MIIDAHQHFWNVEKYDYAWLTPENHTLYRNFLPSDLEPVLKQQGVSATVAIQAEASVDETRYLLELAEEYSFIVGVVGWLNLDDSDFVHQFEQLRTSKKFVGIRPMLQDRSDDKFILKPQVMENLMFLDGENFPVDLLILPKHLPYILEMLKMIPTLRAVVDHLAKPNMRAAMQSTWRTQLEEISKYPNIFCKLSGLVTQVNFFDGDKRNFLPFVHHALYSFGAVRCMFGSDWPVCLQRASYRDVLSLAKESLPEGLSKDEIGYIFSETVVRFYSLNVKEWENETRG